MICVCGVFRKWSFYKGILCKPHDLYVKSVCHNMFDVLWTSVCCGVWLPKCSGLLCFQFRLDDSSSAVLKHVKQCTVTEILMHENETPIRIHVHCLVQCPGTAAEIWIWTKKRSGRPVTPAHDLNRQKRRTDSRKETDFFERHSRH